MSVCAREVAFKCTHWPLCHLWNLILSNALGQCTVNRNSGCMDSGLRVCNSTIECNLNNCCRLKPLFRWMYQSTKIWRKITTCICALLWPAATDCKETQSSVSDNYIKSYDTRAPCAMCNGSSCNRIYRSLPSQQGHCIIYNLPERWYIIRMKTPFKETCGGGRISVGF